MSSTDYIPGITTSAAFPALSRRIVQLATPSIALRHLLIHQPFPAGRSFVVYKQKGSRAIGVSKTEAGATSVIDFRDYEAITYEPPIYTEKIKIAKALMDEVDAVLPVWNDQLNSLARRVAFQMEKDIQVALDNAVPPENVITKSGRSLGFTGTEFQLTGTIGQKDIIDAKKAIAVNNLMPEYLLVHPQEEAQITYLPHYTSYGYTGENSPTRGVVGEVENLKVIVSTVIPAGTAYVVSTGTNASGAYEPLGYWVEKSPFQAFPSFNAEDLTFNVSVYYHAGPLITSGACIAKIA